MERIPRGKFTKEFKEEAAKMIREDGLTIPEVSRRLSVPKSTLGYWMKIAQEGRLKDTNQKPVTEEEMEVARLTREIAELRMERDILKKAAAYFAKESLRGTRS